MKKVIKIFMSIFILNMMLTNVFITEVKSENREILNFITVDEGISSIRGNLEGLALILKNGETRFIKNGQVIILNGTNYHSISNEIMVNENNLVFNINNGDYLSKQDGENLLSYVNNIKKSLYLNPDDNIYLIQDYFVVINKKDEKYNVKYYNVENDNFIIKKEVNDIEAEYIAFDEEGKIVVLKDSIVSIYEEDSKVELFKVPEGYQLNYIDKNNYILFNENEYAIVNSYEEKEVITDKEYLVVDRKTTVINNEVLSEMPLSVSYATHVQGYGWQEWKRDEQMTGTSGESKRLEGIKINVEGLPEGVSVVYRTHVQSYGWQN
ncbi:hypothetical protein [Clostridium disporicum]|uniref:ChW repeat-containing protein n=1 Tax=Clostridium disporicum TaxID=84024 RepID=A0A174F017_9CLOT|nr:hypothetical protein [Clostridium disporicum]CUO43051.1 ChW repeat-containing protein [Clostridium disporicum]